MHSVETFLFWWLIFHEAKMKFDLRKQFYKLCSILAICEIILVEVIASSIPRPFGEVSYLDPVAEGQREEASGVQERRSNKRVAFYDDTLDELLIEGQENNHLRHKRVERK